MKKLLVALLISMLTVTTFIACSQNEESDTPPTEEEVTEETQTEEETTGIITEDYSRYKVGEEYTLRQDLKVREEPSIEARWKKTEELTSGDKENAQDGNNAVLKKGTRVKCIDFKEEPWEADVLNRNWIKIDSGWICASEGAVIYLDSDDDIKGREKSLSNMSEIIDGNPNAVTGLVGIYKCDDESIEYFEFEEDGRFSAKWKEYNPVLTDANRMFTGLYVVKEDRIYLKYSGESAFAYQLVGNELIELPQDKVLLL